MSMELHKRAVERQNRTWAQMQEITARAESEGRDLTAEERQNWDAAEADLQEASKDVERFANFAAFDKVDRSPLVTATGEPEARTVDTAEQYGDAFGTFLRSGMENLTGEQRSLLLENRAQATTPGADGGYLVPEGFRNVLIETMKEYGGLLNIANVISTSTGNNLPWPTSDETASVGSLLAENTQMSEQDVSFGQKSLGAYTYSSNMTKVSLQLLQDSAFSLDSWLPRKLGERIGRAVAAHLTTGTGSAQPQGVTAAAAGTTGAVSATAVFTYDNLVDLEHSIDPAYRSGARFLFHDQTLAALRKLKDADGRPLWTPVPTVGASASINGRPYTIDNTMPVPAPGAKSIVFGDFKAGYLVRQVRDVQVMRLAERYADFLQVAFLAFSRLDATLDDTAALRAFQHGAAA